MKKSRTLLGRIIWLWFFCFICFSASLSHAAKIEQDTWSFDFKNCSVSDALTRITKTTGIYVFTNKPINKKLCKSYDSDTIDQIVRDIFRKENYAMVWYYSENNLDSVDILVFESSGSNNNFNQSRSFRKTSAKGGVTRKKVNYKSVNAKGRSGSDNRIYLKDKSKNYAKVSKRHHISNDISRGLQKYGANKGSNGTSATINDKPKTGVHNSNIETTDKDTVSPPAVPDKQLSLEPPPMPPGFKN